MQAGASFSVWDAGAAGVCGTWRRHASMCAGQCALQARRRRAQVSQALKTRLMTRPTQTGRWPAKLGGGRAARAASLGRAACNASDSVCAGPLVLLAMQRDVERGSTAARLPLMPHLPRKRAEESSAVRMQWEGECMNLHVCARASKGVWQVGSWCLVIGPLQVYALPELRSSQTRGTLTSH